MADDVLLSLTADIVSAHVSNNSVAAGELPRLINNVYEALVLTTSLAVPPEVKLTPAVPIRSSVKPDYLVCLEDGKQLTMLKRYLATNFDLTPAAYRAKWGLPKDYPMVAPNYAARRSELAHAIGLGRKVVEKVEEMAEAVIAPVVEAAKTGRRKLGIAAAKGAAAAHLAGEIKPVAAAPKQGRKPRSATPVAS